MFQVNGFRGYYPIPRQGFQPYVVRRAVRPQVHQPEPRHQIFAPPQPPYHHPHVAPHQHSLYNRLFHDVYAHLENLYSWFSDHLNTQHEPPVEEPPAEEPPVEEPPNDDGDEALTWQERVLQGDAFEVDFGLANTKFDDKKRYTGSDTDHMGAVLGGKVYYGLYDNGFITTGINESKGKNVTLKQGNAALLAKDEIRVLARRFRVEEQEDGRLMVVDIKDNQYGHVGELTFVEEA